MAKRQLPEPQYLRQCLRYEPETGRLFWRHRPIEMFHGSDRYWRSWNKRHEGTEAFCSIRPDGYKAGVLNYTRIYAHRVIWAMTYSEWPNVIDHIDGDPSNNRIENLRSVDAGENSRNCARRSDNTSGIVGVYKNCTRYKLPWSAEIYVNGRKVKIGNFPTIEEAAAARKAAEVQHGYSARHGS